MSWKYVASLGLVGALSTGLLGSSASGQLAPLPPVAAPQAAPPANQPAFQPTNQPAPPPQPVRLPQLTPQEQQLVDQVLEAWEKESDKIQTFNCPFERWVYDPVFGPGKDIAKTKGLGQLKYAKPDKGMFRIHEITHYTPPADPAQQPTWKAKEGEYGEHWVCDGDAVYQFDGEKKKLDVFEIPPEMRGQAIVDGPLPFLFGAKKEKLKTRYFLRITQLTPEEIWLYAQPLQPQDAANYRSVEVILNRKQFLPSAIQINPNGAGREVYIFQLAQAKVNDPFEGLKSVFQQPRTPLGWKKEVHHPEPAAPPQSPPQAQPQSPQQSAQLSRPLIR